MEDTKMEDLKLEINAIQKVDEEEAKRRGYSDRVSWCKHMLTEESDLIAESVISISDRYEIPLENIAKLFDPSDLTMASRVYQVIKNKNKPTINQIH